MKLSSTSIETQAVHGGQQRPQAGAGRPWVSTSTPIYQTSSFMYERAEDVVPIFEGKAQGYVYGRYGTPTHDALNEAMALLEAGDGAVSFSTGMAAVHAAIMAAGIASGDSIVAGRDLYGATLSLFAQVFARMGVHVTLVDVSDHQAVAKALQAHKPKLLYVETVSNPLLKIADVPALAVTAHANGALLLVDSTFTSPYLIQPLTQGADMVIHSATKYLGGHGDVMGGVVVAPQQWLGPLTSMFRLVGGVLAPNDAWLILRGIKTLPLRMERQCRNAERVAEALSDHPLVRKVNYPGLTAHPQHQVARRLLRDGLGGAMVSFELTKGDRQTALAFLSALRLCIPATTLGDVYSLLLHPATSSHSYLSPEERQAMGITEGLLRLSVGIEDAGDILADLDQALRVAGG
jgi:cystathionine beta-lyase/cystathionine gamma-synthase